MRTFLSLWLAMFLVVSMAGCAAPAPVNDAAAALPTQVSTALPPTLAPSATDQPTATVAPSATLTPSRTPTLAPSPTATVAVYGPGNYPANINPLSGLPVSDPSALALPPAMISISNFPVTARPQSGLSTTPFVYEVYVGDGMTRFLATVYGDLSALSGQSAEFGPIRSGRLPYEPLRMLMGGFMLIASGDETVLGELKLFTNVWNPASNDVNGVTVTGKVVENIARQYAAATGKPVLDGLVFDPRAPLGGKAAKQLWIPYAYANNVIWKYNPTSGGYARYQDNYDGQTYIQVIDKQNGQALDYKNVIVLFAIHHAIQAEKIDIGLAFVKQAPALLLRDGKMYDIYWSSQDAEYYQKTGKLRIMRFLDADGNPVPLKPGQTWVQVVTSGSPVFETADSMAYSDLYNKKVPGSGAWGVQFLQPIPDK